MLLFFSLFRLSYEQGLISGVIFNIILFGIGIFSTLDSTIKSYKSKNWVLYMLIVSVPYSINPVPSPTLELVPLLHRTPESELVPPEVPRHGRHRELTQCLHEGDT